MINILQNYDLNKASGPGKVVVNLVKGLKKIGYPVIFNKKYFDDCTIFIPNGVSNFWKLPEKYTGNVIFGPTAIDVPIVGKVNKLVLKKIKSTFIHLVASNWYNEIYNLSNFQICPTKTWAVGIDTDEFVPSADKKEYVLIYTKNRNPKELNYIIQKVEEKKVPYKVINYAKGYTELEYKKLLSKAKFVIWHGSHETQGIACQECLSTNVPILVYDVGEVYKNDSFYHTKYPKLRHYFDLVKITSVPYFHKKCGLIIKDKSELSTSILKMFDEYKCFEPRDYILHNFNVEKQAKEFLFLFQNAYGQNQMDISYTEIEDAKFPWYIETMLPLRRHLLKLRN